MRIQTGLTVAAGLMAMVAVTGSAQASSNHAKPPTLQQAQQLTNLAVDYVVPHVRLLPAKAGTGALEGAYAISYAQFNPATVTASYRVTAKGFCVAGRHPKMPSRQSVYYDSSTKKRALRTSLAALEGSRFCSDLVRAHAYGNAQVRRDLLIQTGQQIVARLDAYGDAANGYPAALDMLTKQAADVRWDRYMAVTGYTRNNAGTGAQFCLTYPGRPGWVLISSTAHRGDGPATKFVADSSVRGTTCA